MYGDLLLDRFGVKFLGPAPLELLNMVTTFQGMLWAALLGGGFQRPAPKQVPLWSG